MAPILGGGVEYGAWRHCRRRGVKLWRLEEEYGVYRPWRENGVLYVVSGDNGVTSRKPYMQTALAVSWRKTALHISNI